MCRLCRATAGVLLLCAPSVRAQAPPANSDCLSCHDDASAARGDGTSVAVQPGAFAQSVHAGVACVDCHRALAKQTDWPHPERLAVVQCAACHEEPVAKYEAGVHAKSRQSRPGSAAARCVDCHGTHDIRPSADVRSRAHHSNLPATCGRCHGDAETIRRERIRVGDVLAAYRDSIHGRALTRSGLTVAPNCADCHRAHDIQPRDAATSSVNRRNAPATCGKCHEGIRHEFEAGIHGERLAAGAAGAPSCADCHTAHNIARTDQPAFELDAVKECGMCHADHAVSYRDTFHGKVTTLGFQRVAKCADCHGAHGTLPASNAASLVSPARLTTTCGRCHEGANAQFVRYDPHPNTADYARNPVLWAANRFYWVLIPGCFLFFGVHSGLWFWRSHRERARAARRTDA